MRSASTARHPVGEHPDGRFRAALDRPLAVLVAVCAVWAIWAIAVVARGDVERQPLVGSIFLDQGAGASETIDALRARAEDGRGYDGQFFLFIALDPGQAEPYIDEPPYRYARILYPMLARVTALGRPGAIPWTLFGLNLLAVLAGTYALARLLARAGASPWFATLFALAPGLYFAVSRDLAEPLAYALVAAGIVVFDRRRGRLLASASLFGLAGLARETTIVFPLAFALALALGLDDRPTAKRSRDWRSAVLFAAIAVLPYVLFRVFLRLWLGEWQSTREPRLETLPFRGILGDWPLDRLALQQVYAVVLPSLLALAIVVLAVRHVGPLVAALAANVLALVVFLPAESYAEILASGRIMLGVIVAFVACLPLVPARDRVVFALVPAVLWLSPWYVFFPTAFGR